MADLMLGNPSGVCAVGSADSKIAEVVADAANSFLVAAADLPKFYVGQRIIFRVKATGAVFGTTARIITSISNIAVTYDGADVALVAGTHIICENEPADTVTALNSYQRSNQNGGPSAGRAFGAANFQDLDTMREYLNILDGAYFTTARLNRMTYNDLVYAVRVRAYPTSIK